jgi:hypothetical protein
MSAAARGSAASTGGHRTLKMSVANMTFLVDRLGADCAPGQFVRELTENGIAAIEKLPAGQKGDVVWDVDWNYHALTGFYKLAAIDTGVGMTGPEMVEYINKLSSSIHAQSTTSNFGVGAKISAAPLNHEGIMYLSWKDGVGSMIHLWRDPVTNEYGLKQFSRPDGTYDYWGFVEPSIKPDVIKKHGTMVVLLGNSEEQNTMEPPAGVTTMTKKWILRYLNGRYFRFPKDVAIRVREGWENPKGDQHNFLRVADGMEQWLVKNSESHGVEKVTGAVVRWWIMREDRDLNSGHYTPPGHIGALFQDEIYDLALGRKGTALLQLFGIVFGHNRVVMYVEPDAETQRVEANTARTSLSVNGEPLPWSDWAAEFRENLPDELKDLVEELGSKSASSDHRQSIRERLKQIAHLLRLTRYRRTRTGSDTLDPDSIIGGGSERRGGSNRGEGDGISGGRGGRGGSVYHLFLATNGETGEEATVQGEPERKWLSVADGTRTVGDMEDRAAKYLVQQNLLLINGDFRVFTDMITHWSKRYNSVAGAEAAVRETVREWFEQQLVEAIMGAQALRDSPEWTMDVLDQLWSPEALTSVVIPRFHVNAAIARMLGAKLGSLKDKSA